MAARSIASLSLSFGLVSIPVKLYSATESGSGVSFNLLAHLRLAGQAAVRLPEGERGRRARRHGQGLRVREGPLRHVHARRAEGARRRRARHTIDIVAFIPRSAVDPIYYDKAYFLAPDKRGAKPYAPAARGDARRAAAARSRKWAWKGKQYVVQVRADEDGIVLQQLLYADEVRSMKELDIERVRSSRRPS